MGSTTLFSMGSDKISIDANGNAVYDSGRVKFFMCEDLPSSNITKGDVAIVGSSAYIANSSLEWVQLGNTYPIDSIFQCAVYADPADLLGFGKWELVAKEPFYSWQRKG